jgi:hypothetical protein
LKSVNSGKTRLTVTRRQPGDIGQREVFVSLDGKEFAILRHGDSITKDVEPGAHQLRMHNTLFWKTLQLELKPGEHAAFNVLNRAGWGTYGIATVLGAGPIYLEIERDATAP